MTASAIELDEDTHTYRVDGIVRPSVSEIIAPFSDLGPVDWQLLKGAAEFGRQVHLACDLEDRGELASCPAAIEPYVIAWNRFKFEAGAVIVASEKMVYHPTEKYCGTLDRKVLFPRNAQLLPSVLDIKSTAAMPRTVGMQTAAYHCAEAASGQALDRRRYAIRLLPDGTYRLAKLTDPADFLYLRAALTMWRFNNRPLPKELTND